MSTNPLPNQSISRVSAQNGAQAAAGIFHGGVYFGSPEDPQKAFEEKVNACLKALLLTDPEVDREKLIRTKGKRIAGTCEWIRENGNYRSWLDGGTQLLWICGGPGKGKTMLSIFLTEELRRISCEVNAELLFYFCIHQDEKRNTAVAVLRGLVYQILAKRPTLAKHVLRYFDSSEDVLATISSLETLWVIFRRLVSETDLGGTISVLDGIDECDENSALVQMIVDIFSPEYSQPIAKAFKLVIVSRDIPGLQDCAQVKLDRNNDEREEASDIERFISERVEELSGIEGFSIFRPAVENTFLERSEGNFLWVQLVMIELSRKGTGIEVLDVLRTIPKGLPALYSRGLLRIESSRRLTSSVILRWVTMAVRPLTL